MSALPPTAAQKRTCREVRVVPIVLQKSPRRGCRIKIRNNRIGAIGFLNQCCALAPDLESILRARMRKIVLQHNHSASGPRCVATVGLRMAILDRAGYGAALRQLFLPCVLVWINHL